RPEPDGGVAAVGYLAGSDRAVAEMIGEVAGRWVAAARPRTVHLASPRSFCAGVERAIEVVAKVLAVSDRPVYVRKQIVHNTHVVRDLERVGEGVVDGVEEVVG